MIAAVASTLVEGSYVSSIVAFSVSPLDSPPFSSSIIIASSTFFTIPSTLDAVAST